MAATPIETIVQAYVATVASQSTEPQDNVDTSPSQSISSSSPNINNDLNSQQQTTISSPFSYRSFFRRAWDKVESIFIQRDTNLPTYYNDYVREDDEDDDSSDEFVHPNPYQQPFTRTAMFRPPVYKRRLSQHSQELISAGPSDYHPRSDYNPRSIIIAEPSDYSPRSSSEWPTRQRYEDWQRDQGELYVEEANVKDLIAGWAMGEGNPWFD